MGEHYFVGQVHVALADPVVDQLHHVVYGLGGKPDDVPALATTILRVDEATGRFTVLRRFSAQHALQWLALDTSANHLIVADKRIDRWPASREGLTVVTSLAHVMDAGSGRLLSSIRVTQFHQKCCVPAEGSVGVDGSIHHGFVVDARGHGVMIDTATGRLLARFHVGLMGNDQVGDPDAAVDSRLHRLFLGLLKAPNLAVVDTMPGRVMRWQLYPQEPIGDVVVDGQEHRVFATGYGHLSILDASSGTLLHRIPMGDLLYATMLYDHRTQRLFFLVGDQIRGKDAFLFRTVDARNGSILRTVRVADGIEQNGAVDRSAGRVYVDLGFGALHPGPRHILIFDAQRGTLLGRLPRRTGGPDGMAVDETTHRLFAAGYGTLMILDSCPGC